VAKKQIPPGDELSANARHELLWAVGDWPELAALAGKTADKATPHSSLYAASAMLQQGRLQDGKKLLGKIPLNSPQRQQLARLLVAGALNSLGKAAACNLQHEKAQALFDHSLAVGLPDLASTAVRRSRAVNQYAQLGMAYLAAPEPDTASISDVAALLQSAASWCTTEPAFQLALADYYQRAELYSQAVVHWQQLSAQLDQSTPQAYYDRLKDAYRLGKGFPAGTVEQETLRGDIDKHKLLAQIHDKLRPQFYLEIGVQTGKSLALAKCEAIGIDPMPMLNVPLGPQAKVVTASSDAFFATKADMLFGKSVDLVFIDGMHLFEYALRDFINVEKYAQPHTMVVIDDIYPGHPDQAKRERCTRAWTGDVWKVKTILQQYRPDLVMLAVDAHPTGLLLITSLNPDSMVLEQQYDAVVQHYLSREMDYENNIERIDAVSGTDSRISEFMEVVKDAKVFRGL
jgi:hypothetical protein